MPLFNNPSLATGRTKFFQKRKVEDVQEILSQLAGGVQLVQAAAGNAKGTVEELNNHAKLADEKIGSIVSQSDATLGKISCAHNAIQGLATDTQERIEGFSNLVGKAGDGNVESLFSKVTLLKDIASVPIAWPDTFPEARLADLWECERALHRVEQLVTDKTPGEGPHANNTALRKFKKDRLVVNCKEILKESSLVAGVDAIHADFDSGDAQERYERFKQIQELRQNIFGYLATSPDSTQLK